MKIAGQTGVVELPPIIRWTKQGGKVTVRRWQGPPSLIGPDTTSGTKAFQLKGAGIDHEIEQQPGQLPIISATYGADETQPPNEPLSDVWDMDVNDLQKSIWEHPVIVAEIAKTHVNNIKAYAGAQAMKDIKAIIKGEVVEQNGVTISLDAALQAAFDAGMSKVVVLAWVQEALKGAETFNVDQFVLRRTRVVAENTAIQVGKTDGNIGRVFSTASLKSLEKAPASIPGFGPLPPGEWLKRRPKADPSSPGKWTLVNEYWHADQWSRPLYGLPL